MLNSAFDKFLPETSQGVNYYPPALQPQIDAVNEWIYDTINNGVYKSGFATSQEAYEKNVYPLFESLDRVEAILAESGDYLVGHTLTEADIRLWPTIVRFDPVYHGHFKCNIKSIEKDYPHILKWARRIYQMPKVADTVKMQYIKNGYYASISVSDQKEILTEKGLNGCKDSTKKSGLQRLTILLHLISWQTDQPNTRRPCGQRPQPGRTQDLRKKPQLHSRHPHEINMM